MPMMGLFVYGELQKSGNLTSVVRADFARPLFMPEGCIC